MGECHSHSADIEEKQTGGAIFSVANPNIYCPIKGSRAGPALVGLHVVESLIIQIPLFGWLSENGPVYLRLAVVCMINM